MYEYPRELTFDLFLQLYKTTGGRLSRADEQFAD